MEEIIILFQCLGFFHFSIGIQAYRLPWWLIIKESTWQCRRCRFYPWVRKIPWRRAWQTTPVFLPEESHGQGSLVGYSPWGCKDSDMTWWLNNSNRDPRYSPLEKQSIVCKAKTISKKYWVLNIKKFKYKQLFSIIINILHLERKIPLKSQSSNIGCHKYSLKHSRNAF